jgi:hypothetical protein
LKDFIYLVEIEVDSLRTENLKLKADIKLIKSEHTELLHKYHHLEKAVNDPRRGGVKPLAEIHSSID